MKISDLAVKEYIKVALEKIGFRELSDIQKEVFPLLNDNKNLLLQAPTGTGKTHAYLLTLFEKLDLSVDLTQAVIIAPTRELAAQIFKMAKEIADEAPSEIVIKNFTGGKERDREVKRITSKNPHIVIGTPGRLNDLVNKENILQIQNASMFVVDECDMVFDSGFLDDVDSLASKLSDDSQFILLSATISKEMELFSKKYLGDYKLLSVNKEDNYLATTIDHLLIKASNKKRFELLKELTTTLNPYVAIIFTNTKTSANEVVNFLRSNTKLKIGLLHGDLPPRERKNAIRNIREEKFQYIVATDLAARGLDLTGLTHVINFSLPKDTDFYIHRTGRTGRMEQDGKAISFYDYESSDYFAKLEKKGIEFNYVKLNDGEFLITDKKFNQRDKKEFVDSPLVKDVKKKLKTKKKVKPNYKKRYNEDVKKTVRKEKKKIVREAIRKQRKVRKNSNKDS